MSFERLLIYSHLRAAQYEDTVCHQHHESYAERQQGTTKVSFSMKGLLAKPAALGLWQLGIDF